MFVSRQEKRARRYEITKNLRDEKHAGAGAVRRQHHRHRTRMQVGEGRYHARLCGASALPKDVTVIGDAVEFKFV